MSKELVVVIFVIVSCVVCVALPSIVVWLIMRRKTNRDNRQAEIILAAIEKNSDLDVEEFMKKLAPPQKSEADKLNKLLLRGCILTFIGVAFLALAVWTWIYGASRQAVSPFAFFFIACAGTGVSYLIAYKVRKNNTEVSE